MPLPDVLIALATLGTAHSPAELPPPPAALGELLGQVEGPPEAQILLLAGALSLQEMAGRQPAKGVEPLPATSAPDDRPRAPEAAARYLLQMLGGEHKEVLPEWLAAAHARGQRPPEELLPYLLDLGLKRAELRPLLFPLLGPRAIWLAEQAGMGSWAYFRLDDVESVWQQAESPVRAALLAHLRWRDPARGRELLASTWRSEGARQREKFLQELAQGLGPEDEPFLEAALDDRARGVRLAAGELLALIPGSAFNRRMAERATALLSLRRGWRGTRLSLNDEVARADATWDRDGLPVELSQDTTLTKAGWMLQQVLPYVPPVYWLRLWQVKPDELLALARPAPDEHHFLNGLGWASYRAGDDDFALLLLCEALPELDDDLLRRLLPQLPAARLDGALLPWLQRREVFTPKHPAFAALLADSQPWSHELAAAVIAAVSSTLHPANINPSPEMKSLLQHLALHAPPETSRGLLARLQAQNRPELQKGWKKAAGEMRLALDYRRRMLGAFDR
ncbi:MAG: DUF5691 domain-containing protein [Anaerolineae bacterium]|nr:DUF5691 domain-containing protein [Anaerolineae bacterium]